MNNAPQEGVHDPNYSNELVIQFNFNNAQASVMRICLHVKVHQNNYSLANCINKTVILFKSGVGFLRLAERNEGGSLVCR